MAVASFVYADWIIRYPEFSAVASNLATMYFNEATLYLDNTDSSLVVDVTQRTMLLYMLTAHIAAGNGSGISGQGANPLVGRISSATEGTVTVNAEYASNTPGTMAWFITTPYGAAYYQATAPYRTMRYMPGRSYPQGLPSWPQ